MGGNTKHSNRNSAGSRPRNFRSRLNSSRDVGRRSILKLRGPTTWTSIESPSFKPSALTTPRGRRTAKPFPIFQRACGPHEIHRLHWISSVPPHKSGNSATRGLAPRPSPLAGHHIGPQRLDLLGLEQVAPGRHLVLTARHRRHEALALVVRAFAQIE